MALVKTAAWCSFSVAAEERAARRCFGLAELCACFQHHQLFVCVQEAGEGHRHTRTHTSIHPHSSSALTQRPVLIL